MFCIRKSDDNNRFLNVVDAIINGGACGPGDQNVVRALREDATAAVSPTAPPPPPPTGRERSACGDRRRPEHVVTGRRINARARSLGRSSVSVCRVANAAAGGTRRRRRGGNNNNTNNNNNNNIGRRGPGENTRTLRDRPRDRANTVGLVDVP